MKSNSPVVVAAVVSAVVAVIVLVAGLGIPRFIEERKQERALQEANEDLCRTQISSFESKLAMYRLHVGEYPATQQGLEALREPPPDLKSPEKWRGPYAARSIPADPWGNPYQYELTGPEEFRVWSWGQDGVNGTDDDIANTY